MKKIPHDMLVLARRDASTPARSVNKHTEEIFRLVADIVAFQKSRQNPTPAWDKLKCVLDQAMADSDYTALDDLAKAWKNTEVKAWIFSSKAADGTLTPFYTSGQIVNSPRSPITVAMIDAIMNLQEDSRRAPTRQEILDAIDSPIDETELSRQLTRLGWNDLI